MLYVASIRSISASLIPLIWLGYSPHPPRTTHPPRTSRLVQPAPRRAGGRLTRQDAADHLSLAVSTLADWHPAGTGADSVKVGGLRFYRVDALNAYINKGE
jgi:hypothetical protein